jgi:hypothetical protein
MNDEKFDQFRAELYNETEAIVEEGQLVELLYRVQLVAAEDLVDQFGEPSDLEDGLDEEDGTRLLASIEAWASVSSHVTYQATFGPLRREVGAMKKKMMGWARRVESQLIDLAKMLRDYLRAAMNALHASSFSIQTGFPWGVAVGLNWDV